jgi:hypothetical protein
MDISQRIKGINSQTNNNLNLDRGSLLIFYNKNKDYVLPLVVLVVSIFILFFVVIPEINQYFASRAQLETDNQKLEVLKNSYNFLTGLDQTQSESDLKLLTKTLPTEKDSIGIINAISAASSKTGISIVNYRFTPGNLSKATDEINTQYPTISMELNTQGSGILLKDFVNELNRTVPLIEVSSIKHKYNTATLVLQFYYKPFPPQNINDESPISLLSGKDKVLIRDLYTWNNLVVENGMISSDINISSSSANINLTSSSSSQVNFSPF